MDIAWTQFSPWPALAGGVLMGAAAVFCMRDNGRIAAITTLVAAPLDALPHRRPLRSEMARGLFVVGFVAPQPPWRLPAPLPASQAVTGPVGLSLALLMGGVLFGAGWGQTGFCPGPALVALDTSWSDAWTSAPPCSPTWRCTIGPVPERSTPC